MTIYGDLIPLPYYSLCRVDCKCEEIVMMWQVVCGLTIPLFGTKSPLCLHLSQHVCHNVHPQLHLTPTGWQGVMNCTFGTYSGGFQESMGYTTSAGW
jgi:hypothetical protein